MNLFKGRIDAGTKLAGKIHLGKDVMKAEWKAWSPVRGVGPACLPVRAKGSIRKQMAAA